MKLKVAINRITQWAFGAVSVALIAMMIIVVVDVTMRKTVGALPGSYETSIFLLVLVMFLSVSFTQMHRGHVFVEIVWNRFPPKGRALVHAIGAVLAVVTIGLVMWFAWKQALYFTDVREAVVGLGRYPVWPMRWFVPLGCALLALQFLVSAIEDFGKTFSRKRSES